MGVEFEVGSLIFGIRTDVRLFGSITSLVLLQSIRPLGADYHV